MIERDIFLLSQTALKDLGVIPATVPRIGEFGGIEKQGDGHDRFEVDEKFNLRYIASETVPRINTEEEGITGDSVVHEDAQEISQAEVPTKIHTVTSSALTAIRQPPGECDPDSDLP